MADQDRYGRDRYREDRGFVERAGDEVRSWFGDDDATRRRRVDEQERGREGRWGAGSPRWGEERSYSSDREYGDRDYGWRGRSERDWQTTGSRDAGTGINWDRPSSSWDRQQSRPEYRNYEYSRSDYYARPEYNEYSRQSYGGPYGRERFGSREWSSTERWRVPGPYSGKGPRGYQRSDERIREEINDRLTAHGWIDATDVECRVQGGEVTLTGHVESREAKRAAEDIVEDVPGVREVNNQLRVRHGEQGVGRTNVLGLNEPQGQPTTTAQPTTDTTRGRR